MNPVPNHQALQKQAEETAQVAQNVLIDLRTRPLKTAQDYQLAGEELKEIKGEIKRIDEIRKSATQPLKNVIDLINGWFKKPLDTLAEAEQLRKSEMTTFLQLQQAEQQKAIEAASQAALAGDGSAAAAALARVAPIAPKMAGISQRTLYKHEVTDLAALVAHVAKNPTLLMLVQANDSVIGGMVRQSKGTVEIPGVRVWSEVAIAAGAK